ncbi:MAG: hypothetical protein JO140_01675 [Candidatus Eremiobacteraeota bacterium]|nr:hypothetical protein [Candidatus Eremiobacteraeota bacterium]
MPCAAADSPTPLRHLAFKYQLGIQSTLEQHSGGISMDSASGIQTSAMSGSGHDAAGSSQADEGTIVANVIGPTNGGGLLIETSEEGRTHRAPAAQVEVRSDGSLMHAAGVQLFDEQRFTLELLGRNIMPINTVVPGAMWKIAMPAPANASDEVSFRVVSADDTVAHLSLDRVVKSKSGPGYDVHITGTVDYDWKRLVPLAAKLYGVMHAQNVQGLTTVQTSIGLALLEDSFKR